MSKRIHRLDDVQIRHWIAKGDSIAVSDGGGLTFTLSNAGTASWVLRYSVAGRRRELTLGNYPDVTLSNARVRARAERAQIDVGEDPAMRKKIDRMEAKGAWTVNQLIEDYKEKRLTPDSLAPGTIHCRILDLDRVFRPKLGSLRVDQVSSAHIVFSIEDAKRSWTNSKRILTSCKQLFSHACGKKLIHSNPAIGIELKALMGPRPPIRKRVMLTRRELEILLRDIEEIGTENALALRILLATCVRSIELAKARWEHVDLASGTWWVPDEIVKTRNGFLVPLTPTVIGWFRKLKLLAGTSPWVLPCRTSRRRDRLGDTHVGNTTLWAAIDRAFNRGDLEIRRFTPHDTRSTAKGHMRNLGVSREISELALNHVLKGMEAIYDVRDEIPERREALEKWAHFIAECEAVGRRAAAPDSVA
ncbi:MAG: site-specific integrase [Rubrivivax sp.]|nr:MAG: site-specific integrase [Rubrivivax sp.]